MDVVYFICLDDVVTSQNCKKCLVLQTYLRQLEIYIEFEIIDPLSGRGGEGEGDLLADRTVMGEIGEIWSW